VTVTVGKDGEESGTKFSYTVLRYLRDTVNLAVGTEQRRLSESGNAITYTIGTFCTR